MLRHDVMAGMAVAAVAIPSAIAHPTIPSLRPKQVSIGPYSHFLDMLH